MIKPILGSVVALALLGATAVAQGVTQGEVVAACAGGDTQHGDCLAAVRTYLRTVGADAATLDSAVADLVVALASLDAQAGGDRAIVVAAIHEAASFSSDAGQAARIEEIAATIASGDTGGTAAIAEVPSSPA